MPTTEEMQRAALLQSIRENPDDVLPRLIYADWLEEQGDPQCSLIRALWSDHNEEDQLTELARLLECERDWVKCLESLLDGLGERECRLAACDFAEHVLYIYERKRPDDHLPINCISVSRRLANGEANIEELADARDAAWNAAWDGGDGSWDAGYAAGAAWYAGYATGYAKRAAALAALHARHARPAGVDGEIPWQVRVAAEYRLGFRK